MIGLFRRLVGYCPAHRRYGRPCLACAAEAAARNAELARARREIEARLDQAMRDGRLP